MSDEFTTQITAGFPETTVTPYYWIFSGDDIFFCTKTGKTSSDDVCVRFPKEKYSSFIADIEKPVGVRF